MVIPELYIGRSGNFILTYVNYFTLSITYTTTDNKIQRWFITTFNDSNNK